MSHFDVFNGDADGICALQQLRLAAPRESTLVTGVKHDIALLGRVRAQPGDTVTVLDISLDRNRRALLDLLARGVQVEYFDHHFCGVIPRHPALVAHIDRAPDVCSGMLVDRQLEGRYRSWAVVAAFGDNLGAAATELARSCALDAHQARRLRELGEAINYNSYGASEADLLIAPADLYRALHPYPDPFEFIDSGTTAALLGEGRRRDLATAQHQPPAVELAAGRIYVLPDAAWARRVQGTFANDLATRFPEQAHAVMCALPGQRYSVSVRAPVSRPRGAEHLCLEFPGGGGRAGAAGIGELPAGRLQEFADAFDQAFGERAQGQPRHDGDSH